MLVSLKTEKPIGSAFLFFKRGGDPNVAEAVLTDEKINLTGGMMILSLLSPVLLTWSITLMTPALCIVSLIMGERSELSQAWTIFTLSEKNRNKQREKK